MSTEKLGARWNWKGRRIARRARLLGFADSSDPALARELIAAAEGVSVTYVWDLERAIEGRGRSSKPGIPSPKS